MSIVIREVCGQDGTLGLNVIERSELKEGLYDQADPIDPNSIMVDIEGIHAISTRNFNRYMAEGMKKSIPSWTKPYCKPMIMHHNEKDGKIIGRIKNVDFKETDTRSGTPALLFTSNISDRDGKEQVKDGRLSTVSIGIIAHDVRCSVCGHNIAEHGECDLHDKGSLYDGERCYWDIYEFEGKELSYVIVPSDVYASNIRIYKPETLGSKNVAEQQTTSEVLSVKENKSAQESADLKEDKVLDEVVDEKKEKDTEPAAPDAEKKEAPEDKEKTPDAEKPEAVTDKPEEEDKDPAKEEAVQKLDDVIAELEDVKKQLAEATEDLEEERSIRESLEGELQKHKTSVKESLADEVLSLRESVGRKPLDREILLSRSEESLKDAIADLKEEFEGGAEEINLKEDVKKVENPGLSTEKQTVAVKEEKKDSNIDVEEKGLKAGFDALFD